MRIAIRTIQRCLSFFLTVSFAALMSFLCAPSAWAVDAFQESGGQVVIDAEHYDNKMARSGKDWTLQTSQSGYSGTGYMSPLPSGSTIDTNYATTSPELVYNVSFTTTGTYYLWARGAGGINDSYHAGIDGTAPAILFDVGNFGTSWSWNSSAANGRPTIVITTPGIHTIHIWMRESQFPLDKLLLRTDPSTSAPSGTGPAESPRVTVGSDTTPPTLLAISASSLTQTAATVTWTTNEAATSQVDYGPTTGYGSTTTLDATLVTSHSAALSGLTAGTLYHYRVRSKDAANNEAVGADATFTTQAPPDTTPPTVSLTAPSAGATVSGTATTVSANAGDNVGVVGVQFKLDGANLGAEDTSSPYSVTWNTTTSSNGSHTLTAVARDAAGNSTTSSGVAVTVSNAAQDTTPPSGSVMINGGATGTNQLAVTLTLSATDNSGTVSQMQFSNDGTTYSAAEAYVTSKSWTLATGDGTKTVYAKFKDAAGNWSTAATDTIVLDGTPPSVSFTSPQDGDVLVAPQ